MASQASETIHVDDAMGSTRGQQQLTWSIWPMLEALEELGPAESPF